MRTIHRAAAAVALAGFLSGCASTTRPAPRIPTIEQLTLDEKIGQMFVFASSAPYMSESSPGYRELVRQVTENKVGGVIWSISNVYETAWVTGRLQKAARVPLIIAADLENGSGMRFLDTTTWPSAMALAATGDPSLAERQGEITAIEAKAIGVNQIYAPVADVNVNPDNPVINTRSYGEDPDDVGRFVAAFVKGAQRGGVLATVKHFPGHGDTKTDSHRSLPVLEMSRERLEAVELVPFRAAIDAGVASVMSGHVAIPALDDTPAPLRDRADAARDDPDALEENETEGGTVPASVSKKMLAGLLRRDLGFDGLIVTDSFSMGGVVSRFEPGEAAVRGIEAGNDQILKPANIDRAIAAVKEAVRTGRISEARIDESVRRILAAKEKYALGGAPQEAIFRTVDSEEHRRVAEEIAARAITLVREEKDALPLSRDARVVILSVSEFAEITSPVAAFERGLGRAQSIRPKVFMLDARSRDDDTREFLDAAAKADVVIAALAIRTRSGEGHIALPGVAQRAIAAIPQGPRVLAVAFGNPYVLRDLPDLKTYLCAYGTSTVIQHAAVRALTGAAPITGKLPVTIPGLHQRGEGIRKE